MKKTSDKTLKLMMTAMGELFDGEDFKYATDADELAVLKALRRVQRGERVSLVVVGPPMCGKSTFVRAFLMAARGVWPAVAMGASKPVLKRAVKDGWLWFDNEKGDFLINWEEACGWMSADTWDGVPCEHVVTIVSGVDYKINTDLWRRIVVVKLAEFGNTNKH